MNESLMKGDPPLVYCKKKKFRLTTQPHGSSGVDVAKGLHVLAHREGLCRCGKFISDPAADM